MTLPVSLPPEYVTTPAWVIAAAFSCEPPKSALLGRYERLLSLAWNSQERTTPTLREEFFYDGAERDGSLREGFLRVSRRQFYQVISEMEGMRWLRSERPRAGFVQFFFHGTDPDAIAVSAKNRTVDAKNRTLIVVVNESELIKESITTDLNGEVSAKNRTNENEDEPAEAEATADQPGTASKMPTVVQILAQTHLLFDGAVVMSKGIEHRDPLDVLCWCAYVYSQRSKMTAPGGVVRNKLKGNETPPEWTKTKWFETLPANFLVAIGVLEDEPAETEEQESKPEVIFSSLPVGSKLIASGSLDVAGVAWQATKLQLEMQMTRNLFELWVKDTQATRYDGNTLTIATPNEEAQAWLESRLTSTVERLLIGILNTEVNVKFIVTESAEVNT